MGTTAGTSFLLYFFVGMMGYLMFSNCVCNNISVSFGPNPWIAVCQAFVVMSVSFGCAPVIGSAPQPQPLCSA
jgi:hypothetical protein